MTTPETAARQFLAALPEGCMNCDMSWGPLLYKFSWGFRNVRLRVTLTADSIAWEERTGSISGPSQLTAWTGTIPAPLLARIEEFATKGKTI